MTRLALLAFATLLAHGQNRDLRGIWKANGDAHRNIESAIVEPSSKKIPYKPAAQAQVAAKLAAGDPDARCFQPGVPRATALPYPMQIMQNDRAVFIVYERAHSYRILYLDNPEHNDGLPFAMGDSRAHWEDETLVVDVASFSDLTWLDAAGHHHSDQLHVVERYRRTGADTIAYEATIEDPQVFTQPWKIRLTLRRQNGAEIQEDECDVDERGGRHHISPYKDQR